MQKLYTAANLQDAYLLVHRLSQAGIEVRVLNEHAQGGLGELPFTHVYPEIWLLEPADAGRAQRIVAEYEHREAGAGVRTCQACGEESPGEFELCWRCGAELGR